jgi:S-adenosylmethionine:tRNA ribosyltransferase-isomerase
MKLSDYDYELPTDSIAQSPLENRQASKMMVVDRANRTIQDRMFADLSDQLTSKDVLVINNTKVFPARLLGRSETGANVEVFLVSEVDDLIWEALSRPARRLPPGKKIIFSEELSAEVLERLSDGKTVIRFHVSDKFENVLERVGKTPLPPYIKRSDTDAENDKTRYQTVYAKQSGSIAAPTAGLHFTNDVITSIKARGVQIVEITLHVGYGTFEPVRVDDISEHRVGSETYEIDQESADLLNRAIADDRRIVAIGTTTTRALESCVSKNNKFIPGRATADLTITPGYQFKAVNSLLTNFHLPKSSLLILVSTFSDRELIMKSYEHAVASEYRFYSYGDCMFII